MSLNDFEERATHVIRQATPKQRKAAVAVEANLYELGFDSLGIAMLVFRFEEEFGVELDGVEDDVDMSRLRTVGDLLKVGRELVEKASRA